MIHAALSIVLLAFPVQGDKDKDKKEAKWLTKYDEALQLAQKEGKPLVIDAGRAG